MRTLFGYTLSKTVYQVLLVLVGSVGGLLLQPLLRMFFRELIPYEWQRKREREDEVEKWYKKAKKLMTRIVLLINRRAQVPDPDYESICNELDELSIQLAEHADEAPEGTNPEVVQDVGIMAKKCAEGAQIAELNLERTPSETFWIVVDMYLRQSGEDITFGDLDGILELFSPEGMHIPNISPEDVNPDQFLKAHNQLEETFTKEENEENLSIFQPSLIEMITSVNDQTLGETLDSIIRRTYDLTLVTPAVRVSNKIENL